MSPCVFPRLPCRDEILRQFVNGTALGAEARGHYATCVHCMTAVTEALSRNVAGPPPPRARGAVRTRGTSAGEPAAPPEPARRALEHGRRVLEREFGIRAGDGPSGPG